jgi:hypothetical protein
MQDAATYDELMLFAALRQRDTPIADLARVLACWLAVVVLLQGFAALQALVRGPAHRHLPGLVEQRAQAAADLAVHRPADMQARLGVELQAHLRAHLQAHESGEAHHHLADEVSVPADNEAALDAAACVLMAALAALAVSYAWPARRAGGAPLATSAWAFTELVVSPPRRPPRG